MKGKEREPHIVRGSRFTTTPKRIVFFDTESHVKGKVIQDEVKMLLEKQKVENQHKPYLGVACFYQNDAGLECRSEVEHWEVYKDGEFISDFWNDVEAFTRWGAKLYIYAHNAKYDTLIFQAVPYLVNVLGYQIAQFSESNPFILTATKRRKTNRIDKKTGKYKYETKTICILSSTNVYQTSLAKLGEVFHLPKLDFKHGEAFQMEDAITYCKRDVEILKVAMLSYMDFVKENNFGTFAPTIAGQAFKAFKTRFNTHEIYIDCDPREIKVSREAYSGGRNECFRMGEVPGKVYILDINSMYPSVMLDELYPTRFVSYKKNMTLKAVKQVLDDGYLICARCYVETDTPVFHKKSDRLTFPIGKFWTSLSTKEIEVGLANGWIKQIEDVAVYEGEELFRDYVEFFYNKRLDAKHAGNEVLSMLYKLFMNSMYGKWGQREPDWQIIGKAEPTKIESYHVVDADRDKEYSIQVFGGVIRKLETGADAKETYESFPAIAAHVTCNARMKLFEFLSVAGLDNVYYMDTDSLFSNEQGYQNLLDAGMIDADKLGLLKLEKEVHNLIIRGCKDYEYTELKSGKRTDKIKGVPRAAMKIEADEQGRDRFVVEHWAGYPEAFRTGNLKTYSSYRRLKVLKREYKKGVVIDGKVFPFTLTEDRVKPITKGLCGKCGKWNDVIKENKCGHCGKDMV